MKSWNLLFGLVFFVLFLLSGQYMRHVFTPAHLEDLVPRVQIRSNHIYLLFITLLNLVASRIAVQHRLSWQRYTELFFRAAIIFAGIFLLLGFWYEHNGDLLHRQWTRYGLFTTLGGVSIFLLGEWLADWTSAQQQNL